MKHFTLFIVLISLMTCAQLHAQKTTAQSGSWQAASTWNGGVVPDSTTSVVIGSGHLISIDDGNAYCNSISFADTSAHLLMASATGNLRVYGDFTADTSHKSFSSWTAGAKIIFAGAAARQTIGGWKTVSGTTTVFLEMIVDKDSGVVATPRKNNRFAFGTSLEIKRGTFLLDSLDDMESKTLGGTGQTGTITIQSGGVFQMGGGTSYIRRGTFLLSSDSINPRIGKMTVYGKAVLTSSSSNGMNFSGIEIMEGGQVTLSTGGSAGYFNPGIITVNSGGVLQSNTTTNVYHATAGVVLEAGGEFNSTTSTTPIPALGINPYLGTVRFSRSGDQTLPASLTNFNNLYLSGSGIKSIGANITVNGTLSFRGSATLNLAGFSLAYGSAAILQYGAPGQSTAQTTADAEFPDSDGPINVSIYNTGGVTLHASRTIPGILTLSSGVFDNNGSSDDKVLTMGTGSTIRRASGTLSVAPVFTSTVNLAYISTVSSVTTDFEMPTNPSVLNNLAISSTKGVSLGADATVNGTLNFESGAAPLNTNSHTLSFVGTAIVNGETSSSYVQGIVSAKRSVGTSSSDFGGMGFSISSGSDDIGDVTVTRTAGAAGALTVDGKQSIARNWSVVAVSQPASGRTITLSWLAANDNGITFGGTKWAKVMQFDGSVWTQKGALSLTGDDPRTISVPVTSLSTFTVVDTNMVTAVNESINSKVKDFSMYQNYPNPFNPTTKIAFEIGKAQYVNLAVFNTVGEEVASLVRQEMPAGSHSITFNGAGLPSGIYFAKLQAENRTQLIKMILMK